MANLCLFIPLPVSYAASIVNCYSAIIIGVSLVTQASPKPIYFLSITHRIHCVSNYPMSSSHYPVSILKMKIFAAVAIPAVDGDMNMIVVQFYNLEINCHGVLCESVSYLLLSSAY